MSDVTYTHPEGWIAAAAPSRLWHRVNDALTTSPGTYIRNARGAGNTWDNIVELIGDQTGIRVTRNSLDYWSRCDWTDEP